MCAQTIIIGKLGLKHSYVFRLFVRIVFVLAKPDLQSLNTILGSRRVLAGNRATEVPISEVHRRSIATSTYVVHIHGGVTQLYLHRYQYHQSDLS